MSDGLSIHTGSSRMVVVWLVAAVVVLGIATFGGASLLSEGARVGSPVGADGSARRSAVREATDPCNQLVSGEIRDGSLARSGMGR
jgi:hypothetical protein